MGTLKASHIQFGAIAVTRGENASRSSCKRRRKNESPGSQSITWRSCRHQLDNGWNHREGQDFSPAILPCQPDRIRHLRHISLQSNNCHLQIFTSSAHNDRYKTAKAYHDLLEKSEMRIDHATNSSSRKATSCLVDGYESASDVWMRGLGDVNRYARPAAANRKPCDESTNQQSFHRPSKSHEDGSGEEEDRGNQVGRFSTNPSDDLNGQHFT